jgi:hypothetical protein
MLVSSARFILRPLSLTRVSPLSLSSPFRLIYPFLSTMPFLFLGVSQIIMSSTVFPPICGATTSRIYTGHQPSFFLWSLFSSGQFYVVSPVSRLFVLSGTFVVGMCHIWSPNVYADLFWFSLTTFYDPTLYFINPTIVCSLDRAIRYSTGCIILMQH